MTKRDTIFHHENINKKELWQIAPNHSSDINFKDFIKLYKNYTKEPFSFLVNDTTSASDNSLTCWLLMTSNLIITKRIYRYQFRCNYLKNQRYFQLFHCIFRICIKFWTFWQNIESYSLTISEIIDSKRHGYLNAERVLFLKTLRHSTG